MVVTTGDSGTGLMKTRNPLARVAVRMPSYRAAATRSDGSGGCAGAVGTSSNGRRAKTPRAKRLGTAEAPAQAGGVMRDLARNGIRPDPGPDRGPVLRLADRRARASQ